MKYYVYVSDSKVDMLFPQVPHGVKEKVAIEWKIDLKVLGASRKSETESEENRIARLDAVVSYIKESADVGSVDEGHEYIAGTLPMRWGYLGVNAKQEMPLVYFGGQTAQTVLGLGGSSKHVIGNAGTSHAFSYSSTPFLTASLVKELGLDLKKVHKRYHTVDPTHAYGVLTRHGGAPTTKATGDITLDAVFAATVGMQGPEQKLEFLAKRLLSGLPNDIAYPPNVTNILLGSPLYVALAD